MATRPPQTVSQQTFHGEAVQQYSIVLYMRLQTTLFCHLCFNFFPIISKFRPKSFDKNGPKNNKKSTQGKPTERAGRRLLLLHYPHVSMDDVAVFHLTTRSASLKHEGALTADQLAL